jgi:thiamine biosynthesis lipoprotein
MTTSPQLEHSPTRVVSRLRVALGTFVAIETEAAGEDIAVRAIDGAFEAIRLVERLMHPTRGTDLAALSDCAPGTKLSLHPWTWRLLELCARLHRASRGRFDPCLSTAPGRFADLKLLEPCRVTAHVRMHVDLGGIAKGYAVDRALDALRKAGCEGGLVNAGGDLAVFGPKEYTITCAGAAGDARIVRLREGALATSDALSIARPSEHRGYYHGLDRTVPVSGRVTVRAASAALADGLTKCLLCGEDASSARMLRSFGAELIGQNASPNPKSKRVKLLFNSNH